MKLLKIIFITSSLLYAFDYTNTKLKQPILISTHGKSYEIKEPDAWEQIAEKTKDFNATRIKNRIEKIYREKLKVKQMLPKCKRKRSFYYDPTYIVKKDLYIYGKLVVKKGEKLNPFQFNTFHDIYVLNADNNSSEVIKKINNKHPSALVMIVEGDMSKLINKGYNISKGVSIFFKKIGLKCYPAFITRGKNNTLLIKEFPSVSELIYKTTGEE